MPAKKKKVVAKKKTLKKKAIKKRVLKKKRPAVKKPLRRKLSRKKPAPKVQGVVVGAITHYFPKVRAAVIKVKAPISAGDTLRIKGHTTDFKQFVTSLQIDRVAVNSVKKGDEAGLLVDSRVRQHDKVYKV